MGERGHGYSALLYGKNFQNSCTLGADDAWPFLSRLSVYIGSGFLLIFSVSLPFVLKRYALEILNTRDDTGCALRAWSTGIITFLLNVTLICVDMATIVQKGIQESSELIDLKVYFYVILVIFITLLFVKCLISFVANCIETPLVSANCFISRNQICRLSFLVDVFLCASITLTIEFICVHFIFIAASFYAAPLQVATLLFVYVSFIISTTIWIMLSIKAVYHLWCWYKPHAPTITCGRLNEAPLNVRVDVDPHQDGGDEQITNRDRSNENVRVDADPHQDGGDEQITNRDRSNENVRVDADPHQDGGDGQEQITNRDRVYHYCTLCTFAFGVLLLLCSFSLFIFIQSLYVIEYENIDGVSGYIGVLAPTLIVTTMGVVLAKPKVLKQWWSKMKGGKDKQKRKHGGANEPEEECRYVIIRFENNDIYFTCIEQL